MLPELVAGRSQCVFSTSYFTSPSTNLGECRVHLGQAKFVFYPFCEGRETLVPRVRMLAKATSLARLVTNGVFQLVLVGDDFAPDARFGFADDFDPASKHDDADN
jgi:hypothetical protein